MGAAEALAVAFGIAYLWLAIRQRRACWIAGGMSSLLFIWVFVEAALYLQTVLQVLYVAMAIYGWRQWRDAAQGEALQVTRWPLGHHALAACGVLLLSWPLAQVMSGWSDSAAPWLDAVTTLASLFATWLTATKRLESWLWWIVVDLVIAAMVVSQALWLTAGLYGCYSLLAAAGYRSWRTSQR
ncbi:MAG: nicotinamide riboside transporter PnuC [Steroidobacteraceae bacterium]